MKRLSFLLVLLMFSACNESSLPRGQAKWTQALYDKHLAYCIQSHKDRTLCSCAVSAAEAELPYKYAHSLDDKAQSVASNPVSQSVTRAVAGCRTQGHSPVQFDPHAGKGGVVNPNEKQNNNGVNRTVKYDPKTGKWSNG